MIIILDFGSQYTYLILKSVQQLNVSCKVVPYDIKISEIIELRPEAIIYPAVHIVCWKTMHRSAIKRYSSLEFQYSGYAMVCSSFAICWAVK